MELTELIEKYAEEPSVKVIVAYLKAPTNPSQTITKRFFNCMVQHKASVLCRFCEVEGKNWNTLCFL